MHDSEGAEPFKGPGCSQRRGGHRNNSGASRVAKAVVSGAIAVHGAYANPEQSDVNTEKNWGDSSLRSEGGRARESRDATRDQGRRNSGSSKNS